MGEKGNLLRALDRREQKTDGEGSKDSESRFFSLQRRGDERAGELGRREA